jgi:hypothetical protein
VIRFVIACAVLLASVRAADADDKVLVLRAEGRADKKVRTKVEGAVLKLAKSTGDQTTAGDVTYGDAATMVGCKPEEDKCKDEVLGMLSVDEIVTITATPKPGGVEISVRRISKGGATKSAQTVVPAEKADQLDAIAPLFGKAAPPPPAASVHTPTPAPVREEPKPAPPPVSAPPAAEPKRVAEPTPTAMPIAPVEQPRDDHNPSSGRRLSMFGMAGGGVLLVVGVVFWASAAGIEDEIDDAPKQTRAQLQHIQDLEAEGDAYATTGNVLALSGLVLGGISTYFFWKSGKQPSRSAQVTPIFGHGTGIAITWGGSL